MSANELHQAASPYLLQHASNPVHWRMSFSTERADAPLTFSLPIGATIAEAVATLGADVGVRIPASCTHVVQIGAGPRRTGWTVHCWWDRWLSGTRTGGSEQLGDSRLALSGVFAGALAVRQVFANVRPALGARPNETISLWTPWEPGAALVRGPDPSRSRTTCGWSGSAILAKVSSGA